MKDRIYLDNNATTQPDDAVIEATAAAMRAPFGNASSIHTFGQEARAAVESARRSVADLLGADTREIVFTSCGTESDNAAVAGVFRSGYRAGNHVVTSRIEHPAVLEACKSLEAAGAEVTCLPVDSSGRVDPGAVAGALTERTVLVSLMLANNETGVIQPIREIAEIVHARGIVLHTDGVQAVGKIPVDVGALGVDLLSLSAHKFHGPKGVGALYVRKGTRLVPFMVGGSHERKRRAGTENVSGIVGMGIAARLAGEHLPDMARVAAARDRLEQRLLEEVPGVRVNGDAVSRLPNTTNLSFQGIEGEAAVIALDLQGVAVSTGSACSSGSLEPSHVLVAMGLRPEVVQGSLRFSFSRMNSVADADRAVEAVKEIAVRLRRLAHGRGGGR